MLATILKIMAACARPNPEAGGETDGDTVVPLEPLSLVLKFLGSEDLLRDLRDLKNDALERALGWVESEVLSGDVAVTGDIWA